VRQRVGLGWVLGLVTARLATTHGSGWVASLQPDPEKPGSTQVLKNRQLALCKILPAPGSGSKIFNPTLPHRAGTYQGGSGYPEPIAHSKKENKSFLFACKIYSLTSKFEVTHVMCEAML
jgi:hypothetical protein